MKWFMRLTDSGVGMHVGILPGYPASHGCIRLPADIAPLIYQKVGIGTPGGHRVIARPDISTAPRTEYHRRRHLARLSRFG